ncbi:MAG: hypothetical protein DLM67_09335 [Candidatus Nephthysia bennettiae]|uniref:DUF3048 domain-containing protein n=1 Tax=Candidatus Nephthysia bennettiae TaxID=3127016 RepID=A0A934K446_9BACT|nr:DUF3048 domain-containing protein [Candidatus Dormibacteraeota bacterium]PZR96633.1 MAG: hypothetical protein DLM67_09335 [Candidatus Dormibacteraeota bacterium]
MGRGIPPCGGDKTLLDRAGAFLFNLDGRVAGSAIAVIAVVAVGSFLGVRSEQQRAGQSPGNGAAVSFSVRDGARDVRGDTALVFTASRPLASRSVQAALHIQPSAEGSLAASRDGLRFTWQPRTPLADRTAYTVRLDSLQDTGGHPVQGGVWRFETSTVPRVVSSTLDNGIAFGDGAELPVGSAIRIGFDQAMDTASVRVLANGKPLQLSWATDRRTATLRAQDLKAGRLQLALDGARDRAGHAAAAWRLTATLVEGAGSGSARLRAPALVQIANDTASLDQSGLQSAGSVYEYLTEGGITRFTAVFDRIPDVVGPVHSGRLVSLKLARHYRGMLFMSDLSHGSTARLNAEPVPTSLDSQDTFYRSVDRPSPDNLFVTGAAMERAEERAGVSASSPAVTGTGRIAGDPAGEVTVPEHRSTYTYDPHADTYSKVEDGHRLQDTATGAPVHIRLLAVLHTSAALTGYAEDPAGHRGLDFDLDSGGPADFYLGGRHAAGRWLAGDRNGPLSFSLADGTPVEPPAGLTWMDLVTS